MVVVASVVVVLKIVVVVVGELVDGAGCLVVVVELAVVVVVRSEVVLAISLVDDVSGPALLDVDEEVTTEDSTATEVTGAGVVIEWAELVEVSSPPP